MLEPNTVMAIQINTLVNKINRLGCHSSHLNVPNFGSNIIIRVPGNLLLNVSLKIDISNVNAKAILTYRNGMPVKVKPAYSGIIQNLLKIDEKNYKYFQERQIVEYRVYLKLKSNQGLSQQQGSYLTNLFISYATKMQKVLERLGILKGKIRENFGFFCARIEFLKQVMDVLNGTREKSMSNTTKKSSPNISLKEEQKNQVHQCYSIIESEAKSMDTIKQAKTLFTNNFKVQKKKCLVKHQENSEAEPMDLAVKSIISTGEPILKTASQKLQRQQAIIRHLKGSQHFLKYFSVTESKANDRIYMEYVKNNLKRYIYSHHLKVEEILNYSQQVLEGVSELHASGIVHRDLKPENFMISKQQGQKILKIIDFGDSTLQSDQYSEKNSLNLGYTLPYSPIECVQNCDEGYNKQQIDIWSIGLILYQLTFKSNPLTNCKCLIADIYKGWKQSDQFFQYIDLQKHSNIRIIETVINRICWHSLQIKQHERISLEDIKKIYALIERFLASLRQAP